MSNKKLEKNFVICNPEAGGGLSRRRWEKLKNQLEVERIQFECHLTQYPKHAIEIASHLVEKGCKRIAVFGGDGTLNEVLQGVIENDQVRIPDLELIFLGAGSSCDFEKMFPQRQNHLARLLSKEPYTIDICKVKCQDFNGTPVVRYFLVNSSVGVISLAIQKFDEAKRLVKFLKKTSVDAAALTSGVSALIQFEEVLCDMRVDYEEFREQRLKNVTVFKCPYFGGGMNYGVNTNPDNGLLYVAIIDSVSRFRLFSMIPALYTGKIFTRKAAHIKRCRSIEICTHQQVFIETDGEIIGYPPATYSVIERAIKVIV
ncbi:MAG: diacylglycerol kinase family protein [Candidatus Aminicenantaceae bacterium]